MSEFDPDAYLAKRGAPAFDPDAYLAKRSGTPADESDLRAGIRGGLQGATLGFADELEAGLQGGANALGNLIAGEKAHLGHEYRRERDKIRKVNEQERAQSPKAFLAGEVTGGLAAPMPGGSAAQGARFLSRAGRAAGQGAALGAAYGLGSGDADLTRGELGGAALETGLGAGLGAVGGAVGEGLATAGKVAVGKVRKLARTGRDNAVAQERAAREALQLKNEASQLGKARQKVSEASRDLEVLERRAELPGEVGDRARAKLASPEAAALRDQVALGKLESFDGRVAEMATEKGLHQAMVANRAANIDAATTESLAEPLRRQVAPRVKRLLGNRALPLVGAGVGWALDDPALGVGLGTALALTQGAPGTVVRNLARSPAVRKGASEAILKIVGTEPGRLGEFAAPLAAAAARGRESIISTDMLLAERSPEYRRLRAALLGEEPPRKLVRR